jgi:tRNA(Ile)-lysidine synthetase-like protein
MTTVTEFYREWMANDRWWFSARAEDDQYIADKWGHLAELEDEDLIADNLIGAIIVLDQLPRHLKRVGGDRDIDIEAYLNRALVICRAIWSRACDSFNVKDWIFVALPFRHSGVVSDIFKVMEAGWKLMESARSSRDRALLKRFMKATYARCPVASAGMHYIAHIRPSSGWSASAKGYKEISGGDAIYRKVESVVSHLRCRELIISLSGGVDSMILSAILTQLGKKYGLRLIAVMINYANRECESEEEEFVKRWCYESLGIELFVRRIGECKRDRCMKWGMREVYESYTKRVRFATYGEAAKHLAIENGPPIVAFGHNHDDCFENILTNITQQKKYDNLGGMEVDMLMSECGMRFLRPMLDVSKRDIHKFADKYGIPHLPNSTVSWSQRGKIRDVVRPCLEGWATRSIDGFFHLSSAMSDLYGVMLDFVDDIIAGAEASDNRLEWIVRCRANGEWSKSSIFWKTLVYKLTGVNVSQRSLAAFIDRLEQGHIKKYACVSVTLHKKVVLRFSKFGGVLRIVKLG